MSNLVLNASWLGDWFYGIWVNLMLLIDNVIYVFINWMYRIFMLVAKVDIFKDGTQLEAITRRIYIIVGIAMLFIFAYNLILLIINPEGKQIGNMTKVVQNAIISIILVTLLPLIFSYLTTVQNHVLESNVIGQIILGTSSDTNISTTNKKAGVKAALDIFSAFYHPKGETYNSCKSGGSHDLCSVYVDAYDEAYENDDISSFIWDDDLKDGAKKDEMEYNWIISAAAGVFALWMFISFALDIGVRVGKIAFYEIISPIPVMMRILPNDKMFKKWYEGLTKTYLSLFIRLAVIYFCMYAITLVPTVLTNMWSTNGDNIVLLALANVVVILGILKFAQEAPKLVSDLFGGAGDLKFGIASKVKDIKAVNKTADTIRGGVYGATTADSGAGNRFRGFFAGASRGARYGYDEGTTRLDNFREDVENGSTIGGRMLDRARVFAGMQTRYEASGANEEKQLKKNRIEEREKHNQAFKDAVEKFNNVADKIVSGSDSQYRSSAGFGSHIDTNGNGKTYDLSNKNYFEMQEVIAQAERENASAETLIALKKDMEKHKKEQIKNVKNQQLRVGTVNASDKLRNEIKIAQNDIKEAINDGAAETVVDGELVSHVSMDALDNANKLKAATDVVNDSIEDIRDERRNITRRDSREYRARRADSDNVRRNRGGNGRGNH